MLWLGLGWTALALGAVGAVLPLIPTVPFVILAAFAFGRGSPAIERWLVAHPVLGPPIRNWRAHGSIGRRAKWIATVSMAAGVALSVALRVPPWVLAIQVVALGGTAAFVWTRPDA